MTILYRLDMVHVYVCVSSVCIQHFSVMFRLNAERYHLGLYGVGV